MHASFRLVRAFIYLFEINFDGKLSLTFPFNLSSPEMSAPRFLNSQFDKGLFCVAIDGRWLLEKLAVVYRNPFSFPFTLL